MKPSDLDPHLAAQLLAEGVDLPRMLRFLDDLNAGSYPEAPTVVAESVPDLDHPSVVDRRGSAALTLPATLAAERFDALDLPIKPESLGIASSGSLRFDEAALRRIGVLLYPKTAYGVLNGGAASSYVDLKKNQGLNLDAFEANRERFDELAALCQGLPKGNTPAYINPDGTPGLSFLLLKLRMLLVKKKEYRDLVGSLPELILPAFQMTSVHTDAAIQEAFRAYILRPELKVLADRIGCASIEIFSETQTMMAAITHSSEGKPRRIFDRAWGQEHTGLAMPGGHGQNFEILAPLYRKLHRLGVRFVWLGNIDNMGYTVDPVSLAIFALSGKEAAFEASVKTPMDVKGGILVTEPSGRITCADIGPALSPDAVRRFEDGGKPILFNCGVGLFDLERLIERLPRLPFELPLRVTDQDKDAGLYAQAEQITWEIIGLLDDPLFFAVPKERRFVAAKMLLELILTSAPAGPTASGGLDLVSASLREGLARLLREEYGLVLDAGRWRAE